MPTIPEALNIAVQHHQAGRLREAEQIYRQILQAQPNHADAWHLSGVVLSQQGRHAEALPLIQKAIQLAPNMADYHGNLGITLRGMQRFSEAITSFQTAVKLNPKLPEVWHNLGLALKDTKQYDSAVAAFQRAIQLQPHHANAHFYWAQCLRLLNRPSESIAVWQRLLSFKPNQVEARFNLGNAYLNEQQYALAAECYEFLCQLKPDHPQAQFNLGVAYWNLGRREESRRCYERTLQLKPDYAEAHTNLGNVLQLAGDLKQAIVHYRQALAIQPQFSEACNNLGNALSLAGNTAEAVHYFQLAVKLNPNFYEPYYNLGNASKEADDLPASIAYYREALRCHPKHEASLGSLMHQLQHLCDWSAVREVNLQLRNVVDHNPQPKQEVTASPFTYLTLDPPSTPEEQLRTARRWSRRFDAIQKDGFKRFPRRAASAAKAPLTIGYLSADFHSHATANLIVELFEQHDRQRFRIHGYSIGRPDSGNMRQRLERSFDQFTDLHSATFLEAAERIYHDQVDILVDLKGYTGGCRTEIVAYRPAPIQVNYLGHPGTMGADFIDTILVDDFIVPPDQQPFFSEQLIYLPGCYQVNDSRRAWPTPQGTRADFGLPEQGFVFCSFNNNYKITAEMFAVWLRLLHAVPGSVLWLLEGNRHAAPNLQRAAESHGIEAARLIFAPRRALSDHLVRHHFVDLFLDTFPVNAHTTASDALWMGCPLITLAGDTFVSRVAGSLLRAVDLPELITHNWHAYEQLALELAQSPARLRNIREQLNSNREHCPLFQGTRFARNIETAYLQMWEKYAAADGLQVSTT
jgi:protein O-GlcNAc transferase